MNTDDCCEKFVVMASSAQATLKALVERIHERSLTDNITERVKLVHSDLSNITILMKNLSDEFQKTLIDEQDSIRTHIESQKKQLSEIQKMMGNGNVSDYEPVAPISEIAEKSDEHEITDDSGSWSQVVKGRARMVSVKPKTASPKPYVMPKPSGPNQFLGSAVVQHVLDFQAQLPGSSIELFPGFSIPVQYIKNPADCHRHMGRLCVIHGSPKFQGFWFSINGIAIPCGLTRMLTTYERTRKFVERDPAYPTGKDFYHPPEIYPAMNDVRQLTSKMTYVPKSEDPGRNPYPIRISDSKNFENDIKHITDDEARLACDVSSHYTLLGYLVRQYAST